MYNYGSLLCRQLGFFKGLVGISCLMLASEKPGPRLPSEQPAAAMVAAAAMAAAAIMAPAGAMPAHAWHSH